MVYCAIPYAIEGLFDAEAVYKKDALVTGVGARLVKRSAVDVDLAAKRVVDDAGDVHEYDVLMIATGASPVRPPIPGVDARNVHTVKTQKDMFAILGAIDAGAKRAVVVGAGAIGIEQAQAYRARGLEVALVDMAPRILPNMIDPEMSAELEDLLREKGIEVILEAGIERMDTRNGSVSAAHLSDGRRIELDPERDFVCLSIGMKPDVDLFLDQGLEIERDGIVVDGRMRTNIPDVYAAGDCCRFVSLIDGRPIGGKLATNAVPMAKVAAAAVAGRDEEYPGFVNGAATCVYDRRVGSTGFTEDLARRRGIDPLVGYGETTTLFPMMPGADELKVKIVADAMNLRIVGGQVVSSLPATDKVDLVTLAIQQGLTLRELARLSYSAQPWQSFFPARSAIVEACENALDSYAQRRETAEAAEPLECI